MLLTARRRLAVSACAVALAAGVTTPAGPATAAPGWRTTETGWHNPLAHQPHVVGLRLATHEGFDRVVVDVRGRRPSYRTLFSEALTYDPSGQPVPLKGRFAISLVIRATTYTLDGTHVYDGPMLARPNFPALRGIALTGSWEGVTSFGMTTRTRPYRFFTLTDPARVVIDFKHPVG